MKISRQDVGDLKVVGKEENLYGKWVLVKISEEKNAKKFVGQVIANTGDMITVKFLKKVPAFDKYVWSEKFGNRHSEQVKGDLHNSGTSNEQAWRDYIHKCT